MEEQLNKSNQQNEVKVTEKTKALNQNRKTGGKLMVPIIEAIIKAYEKTMEFAGDVVESLDEEKFAKAVNEFYGSAPSFNEWEEAISIIKLAEDIDTEKKIALLKSLSTEREEAKKREIEGKIQIAEQMDEHNEKKSQLAAKIVTAVLTAGTSFIPDAVRGVKNAITDGAISETEKEEIEVAEVVEEVRMVDES